MSIAIAIAALLLSLVALILGHKAKTEHVNNIDEVKRMVDAAVAAQDWHDDYKAKLDEVIHEYHQAIARNN